MLRSDAARSSQTETGNPREQALLALWRELDEDAQREIQRAAEEKKRLTNLEKQLEELSAAVAELNRST